MKKLLLFVAVFAMAMSGFMACSTDHYDDTGLRNELNGLKDRIAKLEELCQTINGDISNLKSVVVALQNNDYITSYSALADGSGYQITFAQGGAIVIKHGQKGVDGTNGRDGANAPMIGVGIENGIYYWTVTTNGSTTWLLDHNQNKLRLTGEKGDPGDSGQNGGDGQDGADGIAPIIGVDAAGYWTVDIGDGNGAVRMKDANNQDVKAVAVDGQDGADGQDGQDGADGTTVFKDVQEDSDNVYFTLADDSVITIPKGVGFSFSVEDSENDQFFINSEVKTYAVTQTNISDVFVSAPNGWRASIAGNTLKITAPASGNTYADMDGRVSLIATTTDNRSVIVNISVSIDNYVIIPDADFKAYCVANFDANGDGEVSRREAATVTTISSGDSNGTLLESVVSFEGIKQFSRLQEFFVDENMVATSLDLSNMEYLQAVRFTNTSDELSALVSLNVSGCVALKELDCSANQLAALDVSQNEALEVLHCYDNVLISLDVSQNAALTELDCSGNQLVSLNAPNAALANLVCSDNQLSSLDVLQNAALERLDCSGNLLLSSLDLSQNAVLQALLCNETGISSLNLSHNAALTDLDCSGTSIATLDVSQNPALRYLCSEECPNLATIWLATGQDIMSLTTDPHTTISYK